MPNTLTVVISAGQSRNPEKRELEKSVGELSAELDGVQVLTIPHLYDIAPKGKSFEILQQLDGDMVVISWLFDRATHWVLDRNGVRGQVGEVELRNDDEEEESESESEDEKAEERVTDAQPRPNRSIYCLDFRVSKSAEEFRNEISRIAKISHASKNDQPEASLASEELATIFGTKSIGTVDEHPGRRWYPVIDFSRCTNCMECIDFCLFGVYGVDLLETIVVEQADNCRKGCPACSRVCPQNAIIFPQHKTPAIAGAPVDTGGLKIDLSKLFGAPESDEDAAEVAARERDEQLILAGREAVGGASVIETRLAEKKQQTGGSATKSDDLDNLLDELDSLDL